MFLIHRVYGIVKFKRLINKKLICEFDNIIVIANNSELSEIDYSISKTEIDKIVKEQKPIETSTWNKRCKEYACLLDSCNVKDWARLQGLIQATNKDLSFGERKILSRAKEKIEQYLALQKTEVNHDAV